MRRTVTCHPKPHKNEPQPPHIVSRRSTSDLILVASRQLHVDLIGSNRTYIHVRTLDPSGWPPSTETAQADGVRVLVPGSYEISVGGHQPKDEEGAAGTSGAAVTASVAL